MEFAELYSDQARRVLVFFTRRTFDVETARGELERVDIGYIDLRYYCDKQPGICP